MKQSSKQKKPGGAAGQGAQFFMTTKTKQHHKQKPDNNTAILRDADFGQIKTTDIDFSPLNYRKYFSAEALQDFADELKQHGIISP